MKPAWHSIAWPSGPKKVSPVSILLTTTWTAGWLLLSIAFSSNALLFAHLHSAIRRHNPKKLIITPPKTICSSVDDIGVLRNRDHTCPSDKESPSRRHRLLGSLRGMKSLRSLRSSHSSSKKSEEEPAKSESPQTPVSNSSTSSNFTCLHE